MPDTSDPQALDWNLLADIMPMLQHYERKLLDLLIHDNCQCHGITVEFYMDGSGVVRADYAEYPNATPSKEERLICTVHSKCHEVIEFNNLQELHDILVERGLRPKP